jgi:hypothetical protein
MPNVKKEGSVIEFAYEIKSNFGKSKRLDLSDKYSCELFRICYVCTWIFYFSSNLKGFIAPKIKLKKKEEFNCFIL